MSCYHPLIRVEDLYKSVKAADGHKYHPAQIIKIESPNDLDILKKYQGGIHYKATIIPCGKCIGCRLDYSKEWANRTYLESTLYPNANWFVTLTYSEEYLTFNEEFTDKNGITWTIDENDKATLVPENLTRFIKTFRQIMQRDYKVKGIRFLACGEYGEQNYRPHYHIILLNCPLPAESFYAPRIKKGNTYFQNKIIERAWTKGISNICEANWNTMSYTARYITKKINGEMENDVYWANGIEKEFFRVSRDPGIGKPYYDIYKEKIYNSDSIMIKNLSGVHYEKPPKYFDDLYKEEYPERWKEIKWKREKEGQDAQRLAKLGTSLLKREQLEVEERSKESQTKSLIRAMEKAK